MNMQINQSLLSRGTFLLILFASVSITASSFLVLEGSAENIFATDETLTNVQVCENGLCFEKNSGEFGLKFIQQSENVLNTNQVSKNEDFSNLKISKNLFAKEPKLNGNTVSLFAEKDSFIREGIQNNNEGSNPVLKIMGTGPTNNRVLISFNHEDILEVTKDKHLVSATLKLFVQGNNQNWGDGQLIDIHSLQTDWKEGNMQDEKSGIFHNTEGVTWNCPDTSDCLDTWTGGMYSEVPTDSIWISNQVENYWIKFDVTNDILEFQSADESFGWILMKNNEDSKGQINISSKESQNNVPELVLVFSDE